MQTVLGPNLCLGLSGHWIGPSKFNEDMIICSFFMQEKKKEKILFISSGYIERNRDVHIHI
jgi:hypothetical protein